MNIEQFLSYFKQSALQLVGKQVKEAWNSVGYNIFLEFGDVISFSKTKDGRSYSNWEWGIHIGDSAWRLTKDRHFVVGSESYKEDIEQKIQELLSKKFVSVEITSQFLDLEINFEDEYQICTFFFWQTEDQWWFSFPDRASTPTKKEYISVSCETPEEIRDVMELSLKFPIHEHYEVLTDVLDGKIIKGIVLDEARLYISCKGGEAIMIDTWHWRLEKDGHFDTTSSRISSDEKTIFSRLKVLVGQEIKRVDTANGRMDIRIVIGSHYVLKTFTSSDWGQWFVFNKDDDVIVAFEAQANEITESEE